MSNIAAYQEGYTDGYTDGKASAKHSAIFDVFATHEYRQNRKTAEQKSFTFKDLDIGTFFYNHKKEFYGIKVSRFMYFNLDKNSLCRLNSLDLEQIFYIAYSEVY